MNTRQILEDRAIRFFTAAGWSNPVDFVRTCDDDELICALITAVHANTTGPNPDWAFSQATMRPGLASGGAL